MTLRYYGLINIYTKESSQNFCFKIFCIKNRNPLKVAPNFSLVNFSQNFVLRLVVRENIY